MARYVLVHGAGHGGWCWKPVAKLLRDAGHEVYTPTLTGLGERSHLLSPAVNLDLHITDIVQTLDYEDLNDVILAGHSYGGMVIAGVGDRRGERIRHLVYCDTLTPKQGDSLVSRVGAYITDRRPGATFRNGVELISGGVSPEGHIYGVSDPDQLAWLRPRLQPHPWVCFEDAVHYRDEEALKRIPQTHIVCSERMGSVPLEELMAATEGRVWEIGTGHDHMVTEPEQTAEMLMRLA